MKVYRFVSNGIVGGIHYVTVLDDGGNPQEYAIPLQEAIETYGDWWG